MPPPLDIAARISELWDELAGFPAAQFLQSRDHLLKTLCSLVDAPQADWIGVVRFASASSDDPMRGWRPRTVSAHNHLPLAEDVMQRAFAAMDRGEPDVTTIRNVELAGQYRVLLLKDLATPEWFESASYRNHYLRLGRKDSIWAGIPVNDEVEVQIGLHRGLDQDNFSASDAEVVSRTVRGLKWFYRLQMLGEGIGIASAPITPTEGTVLSGVLQGLSEKRIAAANDESPHTTHDHIKSIYRKYGVSSRTALMALWLHDM
ncbi:MAG: helix-turn-helix transcriptional regulator [Sphingomonadales bacterium 32-64-17]|nr:MAG: helix-turn-helix transcriptional regulator [Sphingomonadales bacterium 32-64-17]